MNEWIAHATCLNCPWETGSSADQMAVVDKLAEKHVKTEDHTVTSGMRRT